MKFLSDLFPVVLFFAAYWLTRDIYIATIATMVATSLQVSWQWFRHRKVDTMLWISLGLILLLGGATLLFHNKHFIMWKPTLLYWVMGAGLIIGQLMGKNGIKAMLGKQISLPDDIWPRLAYAWGLFFLFAGGLNLFVAYHFSENIWVNFKMFGLIGLLLLFAIGQAIFLSRHVREG